MAGEIDDDHRKFVFELSPYTWFVRNVNSGGRVDYTANDASTIVSCYEFNHRCGDWVDKHSMEGLLCTHFSLLFIDEYNRCIRSTAAVSYTHLTLPTSVAV